MFRWKHIASRLTLLVLFATFLLLAVDPLIHWAIVRAGQAVTGTTVSIDAIRTSWRDNTIQLRGVKAADRSNPRKNIFEAELVNLELDRKALGRRKALVTRAQIGGLELGTARRTPAIREIVNHSYSARLAERFVNDGGQWLETAGAELNRQFAGASIAANTLQDVLNRWPGEYEKLETKALDITEQIAQLDDLLGNVSDNPLRNAASYQQAIAQLELLERELNEVRSGADRLHQQMLMDREAVVAAQKSDLESVARELEVASLNPENLTEYLLGPEIADRVNSLAQWVRWGRDFLPSLHAQTSGLRSRGVDVALPGIATSPEILLDTVVLTGNAIVGDAPLQIEGSISGLSSHPNQCERPANVVIQTTGDTQLLIQASFAGCGHAAHNKIVVNCPNLQLAERTLGDSNQLAFKVAPSTAHYWVELNADGANFTGEMIIKQESAELQPIMAQSLQTTPVSGLLAEAAGGITMIDTAVQLTGTLDSPQWTLRSNLGHQLATNLKDSLQQQLAARTSERLQLVQSQSADQLASIEASYADRHANLLQKIEATKGAILTVVDHVANRVNETDAILDSTSPLRESIRR